MLEFKKIAIQRDFDLFNFSLFDPWSLVLVCETVSHISIYVGSCLWCTCRSTPKYDGKVTKQIVVVFVALFDKQIIQNIYRNIPESPAYSYCISQLLRYARAPRSSYGNFIDICFSLTSFKIYFRKLYGTMIYYNGTILPCHNFCVT